jgi:hypothetical protein
MKYFNYLNLKALISILIVIPVPLVVSADPLEPYG